jgi:protein TonB
VLASILLHGGAAAVALLILPRVMTKAERATQIDAPAIVDLDVVAPAEPETLPQSAPPPPVRRRSAGGHHAHAPFRAEGAPASRASVTTPDPTPTPVSAQPVAELAPPRFALSAGSIAGRATDLDVPPAAAAGGRVDAGEVPLPEGAVDVPARIVVALPPVYPPGARRAEVESDVVLELVVSAQGRVVSAVASSHPGYDLEAAALTAVRGFVFQPARRAGRAVSVRMIWTMQFRLR